MAFYIHPLLFSLALSFLLHQLPSIAPNLFYIYPCPPRLLSGLVPTALFFSKPYLDPLLQTATGKLSSSYPTEDDFVDLWIVTIIIYIVMPSLGLARGNWPSATRYRGCQGSRATAADSLTRSARVQLLHAASPTDTDEGKYQMVWGNICTYFFPLDRMASGFSYSVHLEAEWGPTCCI